MAAMALQSCVSLKLPSNFIFSPAFPSVLPPDVLQFLVEESRLSCVVCVLESGKISG